MAQSGPRRHRPIVLTLVLSTVAVSVVLTNPGLPDAAEPLAVSVGGPAEDPAYVAVYAAAALGTFEAEGVQPTLRQAKHPTGAIAALRNREVAVAVTTLDQAVRGAWARGTPVRVLVAHTRAPAAALLVAASARDRVARVGDLRGKRVGIPGPGTTGHLLLTALLEAERIEPWQLEIVSLGEAALAARLRSGDLSAAIVQEPWTSRALAGRSGVVLVDFRRPEDAVRHLGGPFYEIVSVAPTAEKETGRLEPALAGFARAVIRVQAWLAATRAAEVANRLPPGFVEDLERFIARLAAVQGTYAPDGEATEAGLAATLRVLRRGSPWPVSLKVEPAGLREPAFITAARAGLGPRPAPP